jgi:C4-type Zn-finger protein
MKECPLCGETMRLSTRDAKTAVPAPGGQANVRQIREWICPECDYFEEAEAGED